MENNFNLKKFLTENKLTNNSRITEEVREDYVEDLLDIFDSLYSTMSDLPRYIAGKIVVEIGPATEEDLKDALLALPTKDVEGDKVFEKVIELLGNRKTLKADIGAFSLNEEEQDTGYRIYNYSIGRGDFDVWIDNDIIDKDINDVLDTEDEDSYSTLDSRLSFAEFKVLGDEGGIVIIDNHGEGAQYDRDPYKWTQEQWDTIEQEVEKYW